MNTVTAPNGVRAGQLSRPSQAPARARPAGPPTRQLPPNAWFGIRPTLQRNRASPLAGLPAVMAVPGPPMRVAIPTAKGTPRVMAEAGVRDVAIPPHLVRVCAPIREATPGRCRGVAVRLSGLPDAFGSAREVLWAC